MEMQVQTVNIWPLGEGLPGPFAAPAPIVLNVPPGCKAHALVEVWQKDNNNAPVAWQVGAMREIADPAPPPAKQPEPIYIRLCARDAWVSELVDQVNRGRLSTREANRLYASADYQTNKKCRDMRKAGYPESDIDRAFDEGYIQALANFRKNG
jgi:hypothetical protein